MKTADIFHSSLLPLSLSKNLRISLCDAWKIHTQSIAPHPVPPLKGLRETRAAVTYRISSPDGEILSFGIKGNPVATTPTGHSLIYTFSAKERDTETGLSYFGSRYYSSDLSIWLSVDPMSDKYPSLSPYTYCADNPVRLVKPET